MRILHIITGLSDGGAEAVLYRACREGRLDEHVVVSLSDSGKYGTMLEALGVRVHCLRMNAGILGVAAGVLRLSRILRVEVPDAVQTWMYHADFIGGLLARLFLNVPVFWGIHNTALVPGESKRVTIWISRINAWLSYCVPSKIIFCAQKSRIAHRRLGYDDRRAVVINNGYDVKYFHPSQELRASLRSELAIGNDIPVIGFVGRLDPQKDHDNLFAAIKILTERGVMLKCLLVGAGLEAENPVLIRKLRFHALDKSDSIIFMGMRADIPVVMNALDVHVLSSSAEAFPNVLCEAMACGTPCVATDVGDAAAIIGDTGWVVPPKQSEVLADAIQEALHEYESEPHHWDDRKKRARARIVEKFDIAAMYSSYKNQWRGSIN